MAPSIERLGARHETVGSVGSRVCPFPRNPESRQHGWHAKSIAILEGGGTASDERDRLKHLKRENREQKWASETVR